MEHNEFDKFLKVWGLGSCSQSPSGASFAWLALPILAAIVVGIFLTRWG